MTEDPAIVQMHDWLRDELRKAERESADFYNKMEQANARVHAFRSALDQAQNLGGKP